MDNSYIFEQPIQGNVEPFVQKPAFQNEMSDIDNAHKRAMLSSAFLAGNRYLANLDNRAEYSAIDSMLALKGLAVSALGYRLQSEYRDGAATLASRGVHSGMARMFDFLATAPVDYKGVSVAAGVYAGSRILDVQHASRERRRVREELNSLSVAVQEGSIVGYNAHNVETYKKRERISRVASTVKRLAMVGAGYAVGTKLGSIEVALSGSVAAAATGVVATVTHGVRTRHRR